MFESDFKLYDDEGEVVRRPPSARRCPAIDRLGIKCEAPALYILRVLDAGGLSQFFYYDCARRVERLLLQRRVLCQVEKDTSVWE